MPLAIEQLRSRMRVGHALLGRHGQGVGSVKQQVHDGDTIHVQAQGNLGVRFLGVDAPEMSFHLPGGTTFVPIADDRWEAFLADPFDPQLPPFDPPLEQGLLDHLTSRVGAGTAPNHARLAEAAQRALEDEVEKDLSVMGAAKETFEFFVAFASEVMDRYGRLLGYLNRHQPDATTPEPRPISYNERLLQSGMISPYFIWPNVNPFRANQSVVTAAESFPPGTARDVAEGEVTLRTARRWVRDARSAKVGLFVESDPLRLQPFELRFLARRQAPDRWVIDLSRNDPFLIAPQRYHTIPQVEDRLFVPPEFVPLFQRNGWQLQSDDGVFRR
jgi:endonuclease YncB( thermonuclease family)